MAKLIVKNTEIRVLIKNEIDLGLIKPLKIKDKSLIAHIKN